MEELVIGRGFAPAIIRKADIALREGLRRPIMSTAKKWKMISVDYRHRLLLKGDGKATLLTHEQVNRYLSHRAGIKK